MMILLSPDNVFEYLIEQGLCEPKDQCLSQIKPKISKNFNWLVSFTTGRHLLIKQECHDIEGTSDDFLNEWRLHEFLEKFPRLNYIRPLISEAIHYNRSRSIIVFNYLNDYCDLNAFYAKEHVFPTRIAASIGAILAIVHRTTMDCQEYKDFFSQNCEDIAIDQAPNFLHGLERIGPEVFGMVCADGLEFFKLYQRYESLGQAIAELNTTFKPCCLTHNDLKLNNILLQVEWEQALSKAEPLGHSIVRLIDWEKCTWGDPAFDLGTIIADYLTFWLSSLVVSTSIDVETALRLATTPLELLQPSIAAIIRAYFNTFPEIIKRRPDFLRRVVQFTGFGLIETIQAKLQYQEPFGNMGICMLQVAKTLLCRPEQSIPTIFGLTASELTCLSRVSD